MALIVSTASVFVSIIEVNRLLRHPFDELLDFLALEDSVYRVIIILKFTLGKRVMDFAVTNLVDCYCFSATESLRDQMMFI